MDDPARCRVLALYCIVRSLGDVLRLLIHRGDFPNIPHGNVMTFTIAQMFIMYGAMLQPQTVDPKYYKWIRNVGNLKESSIQRALRTPAGHPFVECSPVWHKHPSCTVHNVTDFLYAIGRSSRMYIPVHFLPPLLFYPKSVLFVFANPTKYLKKKTFNTIVSSIFLAAYQFNIKTTICYVRNLTRSNAWWIPVLGGFFSGLSLFIEHSKRRVELALYCIPRALEIVMRLIRKDMFPVLYALLRKPWLPVLNFQIAIALWMTVLGTIGGDMASNSLNVTVLRVVFGSKH
ncbi:hypothetical protein RFI_23071 [Reticulomyxa filosa]|uniref:Transmembrane protein 135 N-terminal domain-containing protein n=1 Tax=Reticulomyxa filosa TaxID=46433 RepID=X6MKA5_RETFI|nr:hypothetical protein RFI_23071 [Reticulomyxa filosa]|eukprot:ETO14299.1 hypothetical protein RFI_23071 [Reticulomyxa filosa]